MMKKFALWVTAVLLFSFLAQAQNPAWFTIEDATLGQWGKYRPKTLLALQWRPNSESYTYVSGDSLIQLSAKGGDKATLFTLNDLNRVLAEANLKPVRSLAYATWSTNQQLSVNSGAKKVMVNVNPLGVEQIITYADDATGIDFAPVNGLFAYTISNNLFIQKPDNSSIQITNDDDESGIVNGQSVHRNEFGIRKGTFWSPKATYLAFYRMDESMVTNYPLVDITTRIATLQNTRYPMAGMTSHEVTVGVYNVATGNTVYLKTGEPKDQYLTNIAWAPDEKSVYVAIVNRAQNHMWLNEYNVATGQFVKTLFEETSTTYVEPQDAMIFLSTRPTEFIWQSSRSGHKHFYLNNTDGKLVKQLTSGEWDVMQVIGMDAKERTLYYTSTQESPMQRHLYAVDLKSLKVTKLTAEHGTHNTLVNIEKGYFLDVFSSTDVPNCIDLYTLKGKKVKNLLVAENPYAGMDMPELEMVTLTAKDGKTPLYGRIIKPLGYKEGGKHPVIVYVYGGPHLQLVTDTWLGGARLWEYYMAQKGYVMFTVDNRGSFGRGHKFESVIHRQLGVKEMEDQLTGVDYLKGLPFVDDNRIGVHGWSFGGFMTTSLMLKASDTFKVGVAGGPVMDWSLYEVMYGERYMDTPEENPEGYEESNLVKKASELKGKLMLIHGDIDGTVVMQHSLQFIKECVSKGVPVDFFVYPQHEHNVRGRDRVHLMQKVTDYFDSNL